MDLTKEYLEKIYSEIKTMASPLLFVSPDVYYLFCQMKISDSNFCYGIPIRQHMLLGPNQAVLIDQAAIQYRLPSNFAIVRVNDRQHPPKVRFKGGGSRCYSRIKRHYHPNGR